MEKDDTVGGGRWLDTTERRGSAYGFYCSSGSRDIIVIITIILIGGVRSNTFQRSSRTSSLLHFDGEMKKLEDAKAWFLGMKKSFGLHDYIKIMKAKITIFSLKEKAYTW